MSDIKLSSMVPRLNRSDFSACGELVNKRYSRGPTMVLFYLPGCRFCEAMASDYESVASRCNNGGPCNVVAVNISAGTNNALVSMADRFPYKLRAFPMLIMYYDGSPCSAYEGTRSANDMYEAIMRTTSSGQCTYTVTRCNTSPN